MPKEIERKFLVDENKLFEAVDLMACEKYDIQQSYVATGKNEVRVRKVCDWLGDPKYFLTVKGEGGMVRQECEFEITSGEYIELTKLKLGNFIDKSRYDIYIGNGSERIKLELDIYGDKLFGLVVVEVEFPTEEQAYRFKIPEWFGKEVTDNAKYKNKNLVQYEWSEL